MKRVCYFCSKYMGEKDGGSPDEVFHSMCGECSSRLRIEERLPELLWAIADLRRRNGSVKQNLAPGVLAAIQ